MKKQFVPAMLLALAIASPAAYAGLVTFTVGGADTGTITFTQSAGAISAVTGTFDGSTISTILAPGSIGGNDNIYSSTAPFLDGAGVSFQLSAPDTQGQTFVNLASFSSVDYSSDQNTVDVGGPIFLPDTLTPVTATPEPGTVGLTLLAAGAGWMMRKRLSQTR